MRDDVILKIQRANKHIKDFYSARDAFIKTDPYRVGAKRNPETRHLIYYIESADPVPDPLALIAGDALQNLRTSLDYLAYRLVTTNHGTITKHTGFPISDKIPTTLEEKRAFERKIEGMHKDAKDIIRTIKPYKGGDDVLWRLHALNILDKHKLLFPVGSAFLGVDIGKHAAFTIPEFEGLDVPDLWLSPKDNLFPLEAGSELFIDGPDAKFNKDIKFGFDVALNEPGIVAGEPIISVLGTTLRRVFRVVQMFQAFEL